MATFRNPVWPLASLNDRVLALDHFDSELCGLDIQDTPHRGHGPVADLTIFSLSDQHASQHAIPVSARISGAFRKHPGEQIENATLGQSSPDRAVLDKFDQIGRSVFKRRLCSARQYNYISMPQGLHRVFKHACDNRQASAGKNRARVVIDAYQNGIALPRGSSRHLGYPAERFGALRPALGKLDDAKTRRPAAVKVPPRSLGTSPRQRDQQSEGTRD